MNRSLIMKIALYSLLIVFLLGIMILGLLNREFIFSFGDYDKTELYNETYKLEDIDKIDVNMVSTDVTIRASEDDNVRVIINGKENRKDKYSISNENNILKLEEKAYSSFCIGFCFYMEEVVIYLPESYNKDINIKGTSGNVNIMNNYDSNMKIETVSGEIKVQDTGDIYAKSTSGDINVGNAKNAELKSTSGDVEIKSGKKVKISTTSGDIELEEAEEADITSASGEIKVGKCGNVNLSTMSGDILVMDLTVNGESNINSTSGEVVVNKVNDVYVETKTTSGDVRVENSSRMSENTLKIKTTSGDIVVR